MHPVYALVLAAFLSAQDPLARIDQETAKVAPAVTEIRHQLHQNPELSNREEKTAALIAGYLEKLGLEVQTGVAHHGVVAILKGVSEAAGATGEVVRYERGAPAAINNAELTRESVPALERAVGQPHVTRIPPAMGSEDFSFFANDVPGFFYRLGQVKAGTTSGDHHTPTFLADDGSIPVGIRAMSLVLFDYLSRHK